MARMHNSPYSSETLREDVLPALGLTVTRAAKALGINRVTSLARGGYQRRSRLAFGSLI